MKIFIIVLVFLLNYMPVLSWGSSSDEEAICLSSGVRLNSIVGPDAHHRVLKEVIDSAKQDLLITSDSISFLQKDIYQALSKAFYRRKVKIYIYYNTSLDEEAGAFLQKIGRLQQRNIHAKFLVSDQDSVVVGSHNWLDFDFAQGYNRSFKVEGDDFVMSDVREQIWGRIRHYGNIQYGNDNLDASPDTISGYLLDPEGKTRFSLLSLLESHELFFNHVCQTAKTRIQIYSPFVSFNNAKQRLLDAVRLIKPRVKINLFIWASAKSDQLFDFIEGNERLLECVKIYELQSDCHNKTIIRDQDLIGEGSFNWLSSSLSEESLGHNLDCSLICEGSIAKNIIDSLDSAHLS